MKQKSGFTLIEMTIVIVIAGVVLAAALAFIRPYFAQQQLDRTTGAVRTVQNALEEFLNDNGRYPCPANLTAPNGDANDGVENCTPDGVNVVAADGVNPFAVPVPGGVLIGAVPYKTLDIPSAATIDAGNNRLSYAVSLNSTNVANYDDDLADLTTSAAVMIVDTSGESISKRDINDDGTIEQLPKHYYFFSHGRDGAGAYSYNGVQSAAACNPATRDSENCDLDGIFFAAVRSEGSLAEYNDDVSNETLLIETELNDNLWARTPSDSDNIYNLNSGNVGVGTNNPQGILHAVMPTNEGMIAEWFGTVGGPGAGSHVAIKSNRGTQAAPAPVQENDALGILSFGSRGDAAGFNEYSASIIGLAAQDFTPTERGAHLVFRTMPMNANGGSVREVMRLTSEGHLGIGTNNPIARLNLHVTDQSASDSIKAHNPLTLSKDMASGVQNAVSLVFANYDPFTTVLSNSEKYRYALYMGGPIGHNGVSARAFEIWEYPAGGFGAPAGECCRKRVSIQPSSVPFADNAKVQNQLFLSGNGFVGIGTNAPDTKLDVEGELKISNENLNSNCNANKEGAMRYNPVLKLMQFCDGVSWLTMGGGGNLEFYDCHDSTGIHVGDGWKCPDPDEVVKDIWSNGGDWGSGGDRVKCCKARLN